MVNFLVMSFDINIWTCSLLLSYCIVTLKDWIFESAYTIPVLTPILISIYFSITNSSIRSFISQPQHFYKDLSKDYYSYLLINLILSRDKRSIFDKMVTKVQRGYAMFCGIKSFLLRGGFSVIMNVFLWNDDRLTLRSANENTILLWKFSGEFPVTSFVSKELFFPRFDIYRRGFKVFQQIGWHSTNFLRIYKILGASTDVM